ncbi:oligosaccharide repeat unit polymerase [Bifidobacterium sp. ESL0682]|uniref:oligosaccharide repeat unit polymerase n=1 Tax=Bifidobacterium sp. ESL0682 TaxID=2983212 RepID=UPI0023F9267C|nr:oligosaccharide repeat unit polymerase [Bifidobacterium sp. ESL0682]WEV42678.1 oligosaccharide repeat unit polymerase [Bifidobacterium sp. ESL0682]
MFLWGQCFSPVIALLKLKHFVPASFVSSNGLMLLPTFTTYPIVCFGYRDLGIIGVIVSLFLIGAVALIAEKKAKEGTAITYHVIYYLVLYSLVFCFFSNMFANSTIWVYVILLLFMEMAARLLARREMK